MPKPEPNCSLCVSMATMILSPPEDGLLVRPGDWEGVMGL